MTKERIDQRGGEGRRGGARRLGGAAGFSLVEVTLAIVILGIGLGITAQTVMQFYNALDSQEKQIEALHSARAVMSAIREKKTEFVDEEDPDNSDFPGGLLTWIADRNESEWEPYLRDFVEDDGVDGGHHELPDHSIVVQATNMAGDPVQANDNPIVLIVTSSWTDARGGTASEQITTILTDR